MDPGEIARVLLRVSHAIAAAVWLGGGAYYLLALRPATRGVDPEAQQAARAAQRAFGEWASLATLVMVATGVVLMFDRVTDGRGTGIYVGLLAVKIAAAVAAFWMAGSFARRRSTGRERAPTHALDRAAIILMLGTVAFVLGVILSSVYPTGVGQP